jgi:hypothetical protein
MRTLQSYKAKSAGARRGKREGAPVVTSGNNLEEYINAADSQDRRARGADA